MNWTFYHRRRISDSTKARFRTQDLFLLTPETSNSLDSDDISLQIFRNWAADQKNNQDSHRSAGGH